ncbi:2'-5' RNA ligase superfamily protein [Clostridium collagenovorans DSM 3089]|uniref:2'-5' RNA ligase superfamily protein n=1 Tax=Clostridium collagenovorans DSM 3089 TaxID=1121306 RepID=A0A1M5S3C8_9CLOT|nr:2'-5' RNA ligase family protein [Clostridium collagenovorans]SHH32965.1 2'-5' RNA ligase superfamily protein [Clostridium collagenovorans DSM 3089]
MSVRTIMIFPEFRNENVINDIRKKYDPLVDLVLPHITLVFPFDSDLSNKELSLHLKECLSGIKEFSIELEGFSKREDEYGNYLFLNVVQGEDIIKNIHHKLYKGKLKQFNNVNDYAPHMTVGKLSSTELLYEAYDYVSECNEKFSTVVKKISVEVIGEQEESIIIIEQELNG